LALTPALSQGEREQEKKEGKVDISLNEIPTGKIASIWIWVLTNSTYKKDATGL
jgi:hypothetical protein